MDKYIIDGVEYCQGEMVEVKQKDGRIWYKRIFLGALKHNISYIIICVEHTDEQKFLEYGSFSICNWEQIRKLQTKPLSGRKAKLTLDDGTEYSVVVE